MREMQANPLICPVLMIMDEFTPEALPGFEHVRLFERPSGFFWQLVETGDEFGPFATYADAVADIEANGADAQPDVGESLGEAEAEIGIADWIDPESGEPAEDSIPRIDDQ